ncbi:hypothetical protein [Anaerosphaera multitolerans]|nr:hypothetical protein [Anaerosphaera multitolerans]
MAEYMARRIIEGHLIYNLLFALEWNQKYQDEVDNILTEKGREDLIEN